MAQARSGFDQPGHPSRQTRYRTPAKRGLIVCAWILGCLLVAEALFRGVLSFKLGPEIWLYGTSWHRGTRIEQVKNTRGSTVKVNTSGTPYYRYRPKHKKRIVVKSAAPHEHGEVTVDTIMNNHGFRGRDFSTQKAPNVFRIITLGASSTFGYANRDNETYPYYLEKYLNEYLSKSACRGVASFEVLNFGVPHINSRDIYTLFHWEGLPLAPDLVTFYEGANDMRQSPRPSWPLSLLVDMGKRFLTFRYFSYLVTFQLIKYTEPKLTQFIEALLSGKYGLAVLNDSVAAIGRECHERKIPFVVIFQQITSAWRGESDNRKLTYNQEVAQIQRELSKESVGPFEAAMWGHAKLMEELRRLVAANKYYALDFIRILDQKKKRDQLVSWVHLSAEGNRILASALAQKVFPLACNRP